jgi:predicted secreted Zn-dependent protease
VKPENRFLFRNLSWSALHPSAAYRARRAMAEYRRTHPRCEITGTDRELQVHHIIPVWVRPDLAADPDNFITLSARCNIHQVFGHDGSFQDRWVENVRELADEMRAVWSRARVRERGDRL